LTNAIWAFVEEMRTKKKIKSTAKVFEEFIFKN
jgi:hypothetical protein